jgi:hypothetical protein
MTDSRDELRSALESQQVKDDEAASGQRRLDDERAVYERQEAAVVARLQEMAALALAELTQRVPAQSQPLNPKAGGLSHMLGTRDIVGWEVSLEYYKDRLDRHILCPDGRLLVRPEDKRDKRSPSLPYTTINGWVQWKLQEARQAGFGPAFRFNPAQHSGLIKFSGGPKEKLERALNSRELLVKNALTRILRSQGIAELT